jgi:hypothetical protein
VLVTTLDVLHSPVFSGLISGVVVAVASHLLTRKKTAAEIEKLTAEAELTRAQTKQITDKVTNLSDKVGYTLPDFTATNESILYNSHDSDTFDYRIVRLEKAEGELEVKDGILSIRRGNNSGTLQVWLESYHYEGRVRKLLPKNESISGDRKLRVSGEVKTVGGEHTIVFIVKAEMAPVGEHLAEKRLRVTSNEWMSIDGYFRFPPDVNCQLRIDNRSVSAVGSSLQIRNLVVAERTSSL